MVPFCPFYLRDPLLKPNSRKKGTLIIRRLLRNQGWGHTKNGSFSIPTYYVGLSIMKKDVKLYPTRTPGFFACYWVTHRPLSSSFLGLPYRILDISHKKELLRGLWAGNYFKNQFSVFNTALQGLRSGHDTLNEVLFRWDPRKYQAYHTDSARVVMIIRRFQNLRALQHTLRGLYTSKKRDCP